MTLAWLKESPVVTIAAMAIDAASTRGRKPMATDRSERSVTASRSAMARMDGRGRLEERRDHRVPGLQHGDRRTHGPRRRAPHRFDEAAQRVAVLVDRRPGA